MPAEAYAQHLTGGWAAPIAPAEAAAARAFLASRKDPLGAPDRIALWLRTAPEGKRLALALRAYRAALESGAVMADCQIAGAIEWLAQSIGTQAAAQWLIKKSKDSTALKAAFAAYDATPLEVPAGMLGDG